MGRDGKTVFGNNTTVKEGYMNGPIVKGQYQTVGNEYKEGEF